MDGTEQRYAPNGGRGEGQDAGLAEACRDMVATQAAIDRHWTAHPTADGEAEPLAGFYARRDRLLAELRAEPIGVTGLVARAAGALALTTIAEDDDACEQARDLALAVCADVVRLLAPGPEDAATIAACDRYRAAEAEWRRLLLLGNDDDAAAASAERFGDGERDSAMEAVLDLPPARSAAALRAKAGAVWAFYDPDSPDTGCVFSDTLREVLCAVAVGQVVS